MTNTKPLVALLHGLGRTANSMEKLRGELEQAGYDVWAETYPSRQTSIAAIAQMTARKIQQAAQGRDVYGVTHSLGGIVARFMDETLGWKGLVMLAPPNQGSRVAFVMQLNRFFRRYYGPTLTEVGFPNNWPVPACPVEVIAGTRSLALGNPTSWFTNAARIFPPSILNDGDVSVEETCMPGMTSPHLVNAPHTWIMDHPDTQQIVLRYLETWAGQGD